MRSIRRDVIESIKKQEKSGEMTEDDRKKAESDIQKIHDTAIKEIDAIAAEKEKEILTV